MYNVSPPPPSPSVPEICNVQRAIPRDLPPVLGQCHTLLLGMIWSPLSLSLSLSSLLPAHHMTLLPPILFLRLPYLPHKGDTPDLDDADGTHGFSIVSQVTDILNNALNPTCASNAISLLCHTFFKECKAVEDATTGTPLWLPSLLCRSECDRHL